jgi:excisionase family DNA binding protein
MNPGATDPVPPELVPDRGMTVSEVAVRLRVSPDKVRAWISRGEVAAVNTADLQCGRPRWVVTAEALEAFEQRRRGGPAPKAQRRRRPTQQLDYYP